MRVAGMSSCCKNRAKKKSAAVCDTLYHAECYANYCSALRFVRWMASDIAGIERMTRVITASAPM